jgi:TonB family protein
MSAALLLFVLAQAPPAVPAAVSNPAPAADAVRIAGRDVPWPKRTRSITPVYPPAAAAVGQRGIVIVQILVGPDGKVAAAEVVRSVPPFDAPALAAVRQWEYEVTRVNGQPVPVQLTIPITFALRLPDVTREPGVPEMRQGVAPPFPAGAAPKEPARVTAELTLDGDGQVREAAITGGDPPYTEALLQAVRTWAFVPLQDQAPASLDVEAVFSAGKEGQRVQMRLFGLREAPRAAAAAPVAPAPSPAAPAPAPVVPEPSPAAAPAPSPAAAAPAPQPAPPAAQPRVTPAPAAPAATQAPAPGQAAPPVEVVPAPPAPKPTDTSSMETGVSAVRDVALTAGVPDLTSGRRPLVPPFARMEGLTGQVEVKFVVEASGATSNLEVHGPDRLKEAARQTVSSWTFRRTSTERLFLTTTIEYGGETAKAAVKRQS